MAAGVRGSPPRALTSSRSGPRTDCLVKTARAEGFLGMYRGGLPGPWGRPEGAAGGGGIGGGSPHTVGSQTWGGGISARGTPGTAWLLVAPDQLLWSSGDTGSCGEVRGRPGPHPGTSLRYSAPSSPRCCLRAHQQERKRGLAGPTGRGSLVSLRQAAVPWGAGARPERRAGREEEAARPEDSSSQYDEGRAASTRPVQVPP